MSESICNAIVAEGAVAASWARRGSNADYNQAGPDCADTHTHTQQSTKLWRQTEQEGGEGGFIKEVCTKPSCILHLQLEAGVCKHDTIIRLACLEIY
jgi:hypothetical protein